MGNVGFWIEGAEDVKKNFGNRFFELSLSFNLKSKIKNRKWVALLAPVLTLALGGAPAMAQSRNTARIGYLDSSTAAGSAEFLEAFRKQMTQLNWIEGKNLTIAYRYAEGKGATRLAEQAAELAGLKVD